MKRGIKKRYQEGNVKKKKEKKRRLRNSNIDKKKKDERKDKGPQKSILAINII